MALTQYGRLRDGLLEIQDEFRKARSCTFPLYHDLIWSPDFEGWGQADYQGFVLANQSKYTDEEWELWPDGIACSRYYGSIAFSATNLPQFRNLAGRAYRILRAISRLDFRHYQLVAPASVNFSVIAESIPNHSDSAVHFGWLELIHDAGLYHPSSSLQSNNGWWKYEGAGDPLEAKHPSYLSVSADLFEASAEYIQMILEPDTVGFLQSESYQVQIAVGGNSETHTITHRPTICIPDEFATPFWDAENGELWFGSDRIIAFEQKAPNQRKVLDEFEARGWPARIENPFRKPNVADYQMDQTLKTTINDLKRNREDKTVISFGFERDGKYAYWNAM